MSLENVSVNLLSLAEDDNEKLKDDIMGALKQHDIYSTFDVRNQLRDDIKSSKDDARLNVALSRLEDTYMSYNNLLIVVDPDNGKFDTPQEGVIQDVYNQFKFGDGMSRQQAEAEISKLRDSNVDVESFLIDFYDDAQAYDDAYDTMIDAMNNAIAELSAGCIKTNAKILANLIGIRNHTHSKEIVRLTDDARYVKLSDSQIFEMLADCRAIDAGESITA